MNDDLTQLIPPDPVINARKEMLSELRAHGFGMKLSDSQLDRNQGNVLTFKNAGMLVTVRRLGVWYFDSEDSSRPAMNLSIGHGDLAMVLKIARLANIID